MNFSASPRGRGLAMVVVVALTSAVFVAFSPPHDARAQSTTTKHPLVRVVVPMGDSISVAMQQDIGSRISAEGDTFAVITVEDYYVRGNLVLPKGSPGYGTVTRIKRAGHFFAHGELAFTVDRLVAPNGTPIAVATAGMLADADKTQEKNGNALAQLLLCRVCVVAKRGNDVLVKNGTAFHVETSAEAAEPVIALGSSPAPIDPALVHHK